MLAVRHDHDAAACAPAAGAVGRVQALPDRLAMLRVEVLNTLRRQAVAAHAAIKRLKAKSSSRKQMDRKTGSGQSPFAEGHTMTRGKSRCAFCPELQRRCSLERVRFSLLHCSERMPWTRRAAWLGAAEPQRDDYFPTTFAQ